MQYTSRRARITNVSDAVVYGMGDSLVGDAKSHEIGSQPSETLLPEIIEWNARLPQHFFALISI
jgi:hypothetical protein